MDPILYVPYVPYVPYASIFILIPVLIPTNIPICIFIPAAVPIICFQIYPLRSDMVVPTAQVTDTPHSYSYCYGLPSNAIPQIP